MLEAFINKGQHKPKSQMELFLHRETLMFQD